jgi:hypothetical protein
MNSRGLFAYRNSNSRGRLALHRDTGRRNAQHDTEPAAGASEEPERVLQMLIGKAQESIEASRALISKIDAILRGSPK